MGNEVIQQPAIAVQRRRRTKQQQKGSLMPAPPAGKMPGLKPPKSCAGLAVSRSASWTISKIVRSYWHSPIAAGNIQLRASARGWATMYLKQHPWNGHRRRSRIDYEQDALRQGHIAVNSILRDWIKGQVTAVESGILSFEEVFLPHMLSADGRRVIERVQELLPKPAEQKVVALPAR